MVIAMVANTARDTKKRPLPFTASEFLPQWRTAGDGTPAPEPSDDEVREAVRAMNAAFGGTSRPN